MARTAFAAAVAALLLAVSPAWAQVTCPGVKGFCSQSFPGQTCVVVCSRGRNNVPVCQADGTWSDAPRCIEHDPGRSGQRSLVCPAVPGYCADANEGERCSFACAIGPHIDSVCTGDGTWLPFPTCVADVRETQDGCNPCDGPNGRPRNRPLEAILGLGRSGMRRRTADSASQSITPKFAGRQTFLSVDTQPATSAAARAEQPRQQTAAATSALNSNFFVPARQQQARAQPQEQQRQPAVRTRRRRPSPQRRVVKRPLRPSQQAPRPSHPQQPRDEWSNLPDFSQPQPQRPLLEAPAQPRRIPQQDASRTPQSQPQDVWSTLPDFSQPQPQRPVQESPAEPPPRRTLPARRIDQDARDPTFVVQQHPSLQTRDPPFVVEPHPSLQVKEDPALVPQPAVQKSSGGGGGEIRTVFNPQTGEHEEVHVSAERLAIEEAERKKNAKPVPLFRGRFKVGPDGKLTGKPINDDEEMAEETSEVAARGKAEGQGGDLDPFHGPFQVLSFGRSDEIDDGEGSFAVFDAAPADATDEKREEEVVKDDKHGPFKVVSFN